MRLARLAGAGKTAGHRSGCTAARLGRSTGFAFDWRGPAVQAEAMRLADHRIPGDATQDPRNLAGGLALTPEFP
jgi:hypothetical protein